MIQLSQVTSKWVRLSMGGPQFATQWEKETGPPEPQVVSVQSGMTRDTAILQFIYYYYYYLLVYYYYCSFIIFYYWHVFLLRVRTDSCLHY